MPSKILRPGTFKLEKFSQKMTFNFNMSCREYCRKRPKSFSKQDLCHSVCGEDSVCKLSRTARHRSSRPLLTGPAQSPSSFLCAPNLFTSIFLFHSTCHRYLSVNNEKRKPEMKLNSHYQRKTRVSPLGWEAQRINYIVGVDIFLHFPFQAFGKYIFPPQF